MKIITGAVSLLVGLFSATAMFWAGMLFEHRPAGWPNIPLNVGPFHFTFHLPESPAAQLAALKAAEASAAQHVKAIVQTRTVALQAASTHDIQAQTKIRTITQTITKEIPDAVPPASDVPLSFGWVRLHDAAILGVSPAAPLPGEPDGAPSGIKASAALGNDVANFGTCAATRQQLIDLQSAARAVEAAR